MRTVVERSMPRPRRALAVVGDCESGRNSGPYLNLEKGATMAVLVVLIAVGVLALIGLSLSLRIVKQYEQGVVFRLGRVVAVRQPGLIRIVPVIDVIRRVS